MVQAALAGIGIAALPCVLGDTKPALRRLTPAVIATRPMCLVYRREARLSAEVRAVIRFVVDVVRENAPLMSGCPRTTLVENVRAQGTPHRHAHELLRPHGGPAACWLN